MELPTLPSSSVLDASLIAATLQRHLPFRGDLDQCVPLAGDASNRRYYRLHLSHSSIHTLILMQLADPEAFKVSEEAVSEPEPEMAELPFINILKHLQNNRIPVPDLYYYDAINGLLYLEDFGDATLAQACRSSSPDMIERYYAQAIDQLVQLHLQASHPSDVPCVAFTRAFTIPLYMWEFDHFLEYGVVARQGRPMCSTDYVAVRDEFVKMAEWLAAQPQVFSHRDYHSRNLMMDRERIGIIDFQDALMGPVTYDLASLLRDSYMALDEDFIEKMTDRYREGMRHGLPLSLHEAMLLHDAQAFRRLFDISSIQRNLKAAGRFVYIDRIKGNPKFLSSIPHTLQNVRTNLDKYPELYRLKVHLTPYIPEWQ